ncbi:MAG: two-component system sensor histidine kinase NtrB, partial [Candidatus Ratteibacteria bacterium]
EEKKEIVKEFEKFGYEVAVGIGEKDEVRGVIFLKGKLDKRIFSYKDQLILTNLGYQIGLAIENIKLYHRISEMNTYIRSLLDNSPFGVVSIDREGKILIFNRQMEKFFNKKEKEISGKKFEEFLPSEIIPYVKEKLSGLDKELTGKEIEIKIWGKNIIFYTVVVPIFENGKLLGVQVIFSDITKIRQLEEEIKRTEKLASLGVMAAGVAHEIKNPLVAIKTFVDLFPERYNDEEFREVYSKILQGEVNRINHLVEQILLFANPKPSKIEEINIVEILKTSVVLGKLQFPDKDVKIIENLPEKDVIIKGDAEKLRQVFLNIVRNSFEAIDNSDGLIELNLKEDNERVEILIRDNGIGIKKEIMNKIFDPFFTTKEKGTGLGLSIVLRIIEEHKGKIRIESEEGEGTRIYIYLPKGSNT